MRHFCPAHAERIRHDEDNALSSWNELINRGMQSYMACRASAASMYFSAAQEIALLRLYHKKNTQFQASHLLRPLEFLFELMLVEEQYQEIRSMLVSVRRFLLLIQSPEQQKAQQWLSHFHKKHEQVLGPCPEYKSTTEQGLTQKQSSISLQWTQTG